MIHLLYRHRSQLELWVCKWQTLFGVDILVGVPDAGHLWLRGIVYRLPCLVLAATQSCQLAGLCLRFVVVDDDGGECVVSLFGIVSLLGSVSSALLDRQFV